MKRKLIDPNSPELIEAILERMRTMTREEWIAELAWKPENAEETWMMAKYPLNGGPDGDGATADHVRDESTASAAAPSVPPSPG